MPSRLRKAPPPQLWKEMTMSLTGFLALPDEIKVMILKYILPTGLTLTAGSLNKKLLDMPEENYTLNSEFAEKSYSLNKEVQKDFQVYVFPLLTAIPAIKHIVYDVLFDTNKICISRPEANAFWYPPASMSTCVRRVVLRTETDDGCLAFLRRFASGAFGFPSLVEVNIKLIGWTDPGREWTQTAKRLEAHTPIKFTVKKLTVSYEHHSPASYRGCYYMILYPDDNEMVVLGKVLLEGGKEDKTGWKQYTCNRDGDWRKRANDYEEWPEEEEYTQHDAEDGATQRKTVKIMEA